VGRLLGHSGDAAALAPQFDRSTLELPAPLTRPPSDPGEPS
jgi:hypothetical protein